MSEDTESVMRWMQTFREDTFRELGVLKTSLEGVKEDISEIKQKSESLNRAVTTIAVHDKKLEQHCTDIVDLKNKTADLKETVGLHKVLFGLIGTAIVLITTFFSGLLQRIFG